MSIDYNSATNQKIKGELVNRDVLMRANITIKTLLESSDTGLLDDIGDLDVLRPEFKNWFWESDAYYNNSDEFKKFDEYTEEEREELTTELENSGRFDDEYYSDTDAEGAYEYWFVTEWLADKLKENGETIIDGLDQMVWCRRTTGQAILLDYVISKIAEGMEILEGQANDWSRQHLN